MHLICNILLLKQINAYQTYVFPGDFFREKISSLLMPYSTAPGTWKKKDNMTNASCNLSSVYLRETFLLCMENQILSL